MREIKFRAWDKRLKQWLHDKIKMADGFHVIGEVMAFGVIEQYCLENEAEAETVLQRLNDIVLVQYTGLKDKNGKELYENDIVFDVRSEKHYVIQWKKAYSGFLFCLCDARGEIDNYYGGMESEHILLVGNIHENEELLYEN